MLRQIDRRQTSRMIDRVAELDAARKEYPPHSHDGFRLGETCEVCGHWFTAGYGTADTHHHDRRESFLAKVAETQAARHHAARQRWYRENGRDENGIVMCGEVGTGWPNGTDGGPVDTAPCRRPAHREHEHDWAERERLAKENVSWVAAGRDRLAAELDAADPYPEALAIDHAIHNDHADGAES